MRAAVAALVVLAAACSDPADSGPAWPVTYELAATERFVYELGTVYTRPSGECPEYRAAIDSATLVLSQSSWTFELYGWSMGGAYGAAGQTFCGPDERTDARRSRSGTYTREGGWLQLTLTDGTDFATGYSGDRLPATLQLNVTAAHSLGEAPFWTVSQSTWSRR